MRRIMWWCPEHGIISGIHKCLKNLGAVSDVKPVLN